MSEFFNADKPSRQAAFVVDGPNGSVTAVAMSDSPFGGDKNTKSHVQPANMGDACKTLPGEAEDPRLC